MVLIRGDLDAMKLLVTWRHVAHHTRTNVRRRAWSQVSGLPATVIKLKEPMLFASGLLHEDGTVEEAAMALIRREFASVIPDEGTAA